MKLIMPVEHRIQLKAEQYEDADLARDAIEVSELRSQLELERAGKRRLDVYSWCLTILLAAIATWWFK